MNFAYSTCIIYVRFAFYMRFAGVLASFILISFSAKSQKTLHPDYVVERLGMEHLLPKSTLSNPERTLDRISFLKDSLNLSPKDYKWHCLEWFKLKSKYGTADDGTSVKHWKLGVDQAQAFKNTYIYALFRFSYDENRIFGNVRNGGKIELSHFLNTLELAGARNDHQMVFDGYIQIADIYIDLNKRQKALKWLERAKKMLPLVDGSANKSLYYTFLGDAQNPFAYDSLGKLQWPSEEYKNTTLDNVKKGIHFGELATKEGDGRFIQLHLSYCILADFTSDRRERLNYEKEALRSGYILKLPIVDAQYHSRISGVYLGLNSLDTAKMYIDSAAVHLNQPNAGLFFNSRILRRYVEYYTAVNDNDSLIKYLKLYHNVSIAINSEQAAADLSIKESIFNDEKQKSTIREQKLTLAQEKARTTWIIWSLMITLGLLSALLFIFIRLRKRKNEIEEKRAEIEQANNQLEDLLKENKVLLNETHHRVKNNLQVISSLLESQVDVAKNTEVEEAIIAAQSRIGTMAYVHDLLYKQDDHSNLEIGPYIESLARQVAQFHRDEDNLLVTVDCHNILYPLNRAIHMGIFINELLTNSHKHARVEGKQLIIAIQLEESSNNYTLVYKDNGSGLPKGLETEKSGSIGLYLLKSMARQLRGKLSYETNNGSVYTLNCRK